MAKTVKRHKKPNKRSIAAKARWAKIKAGKGYSSPSDIVARMMDKDEWNTDGLKIGDQLRIRLPQDYIVKNTDGSDATNRLKELITPQTRLDIIYHDLEQAVKEVIEKLKSIF